MASETQFEVQHTTKQRPQAHLWWFTPQWGSVLVLVLCLITYLLLPLLGSTFDLIEIIDSVLYDFGINHFSTFDEPQSLEIHGLLTNYMRSYVPLSIAVNLLCLPYIMFGLFRCYSLDSRVEDYGTGGLSTTGIVLYGPWSPPFLVVFGALALVIGFVYLFYLEGGK